MKSVRRERASRCKEGKCSKSDNVDDTWKFTRLYGDPKSHGQRCPVCGTPNTCSVPTTAVQDVWEFADMLASLSSSAFNKMSMVPRMRRRCGYKPSHVIEVPATMEPALEDI